MSSQSDSPRGSRTDGADAASDGVLPENTSSGSRRTAWWSRMPGITFVRAHRRGLRRASASVIGMLVAAAVLFGSAGSLPPGGTAGYGDAPLRPYAASPAVVVGENITIDQVLGVLERAQRLAQEQGASLDPQIAQAAAELGMLYMTYRAQQEAMRAASGILDPRDGSMVGVPKGDGTAGDEPGESGVGESDEAGHTGEEGAVTGVSRVHGHGDEPADEQGADKPDDEHDADESADEQGADEPADEHDADERVDEHDTGEHDADDSHDHEAGEETHDHDRLVTREDLALAAQRLARLMDLSGADTFIVAPVPAGEEAGATGSGDPALRESLVSVVDAFGSSTAGFANGRIPPGILCPIEFAPGHRLRCDAAERLAALNLEFQERFGRSLPITDSYRTYDAQVQLRVVKPALAAIPGTSNHGWGIAVDFGVPINTGRSAEYHWLRVHGPDYGWDNPVWARFDGSKPEPWHFEFFAAGAIPNRASNVPDIASDGDPRYRPPEKPKPGAEPPVVPARDTKGPSGGSDDPSEDPGDGSTPSAKPPKPTPKPSEPGGEPSPSPSEPDGNPSLVPPSPSPSPSGTPSPSPSPGTPSPSPSPSPSPGTPSPSPSPSGDPDPSPSGTPTPTPSPAPTPSPSPSPSPDEPGDEPSAPGEGDESGDPDARGDDPGECTEPADDSGESGEDAEERSDGVAEHADGAEVRAKERAEKGAAGSEEGDTADDPRCDLAGDDAEEDDTPSSSEPADEPLGRNDAASVAVGSNSVSRLARRR